MTLGFIVWPQKLGKIDVPLVLLLLFAQIVIGQGLKLSSNLATSTIMMAAANNENGTRKKTLEKEHLEKVLEKEHFIMTATPTAANLTDYFEN